MEQDSRATHNCFGSISNALIFLIFMSFNFKFQEKTELFTKINNRSRETNFFHHIEVAFGLNVFGDNENIE